MKDIPDAVVSSTPIFNLPEDLMYEIFLELCDGIEDPAPKLSLVCRRWRNAILDAPILWSNIQFRTPPPYYIQELRLQRSKSAPLIVTIIPDIYSSLPMGMRSLALIIKLLRPHVHRFDSLNIMSMKPKGLRTFFDELGHIEAPLLKHLVVRGAVDAKKWTLKPFGGYATGLLTLHVVTGRTNWDSSLLCHLTTLSLGDTWCSWDISVFDILTTLSQTPCLRDLSLQFDDGDLRIGKTWKSSQVKLECLVNIYISGLLHSSITKPWVECLLFGILAPGLSAFPSNISPTCLTALNNCPTFPLPGLKNLQMIHNPTKSQNELTISLNSFPALIKNLPQLRQLTLRGTQLDEITLHTLSTQLPFLDTLVICDLPLSFGGLKVMVLARIIDDNLSALRSLFALKSYRVVGWPESEVEWFKAHIFKVQA